MNINNDTELANIVCNDLKVICHLEKVLDILESIGIVIEGDSDDGHIGCQLYSAISAAYSTVEDFINADESKIDNASNEIADFVNGFNSGLKTDADIIPFLMSMKDKYKR
jgi:hypothetical protein